MTPRKLLNPKYQNIETIIFDFGNVLLDINIELTTSKFRELGLLSFAPKDIHPNNKGVFIDIEIGAITPDQFYDNLRAGTTVETSEIAAAWNALLLPYDYRRFEMVLELRKTYKVCLLSNTNKAHHDYFENVFNEENTLGITFKELFDFTLYSDELKCRKPDAEIYEKAAQIAQINPHTTLFIDDNEPNLWEPQKMGWKTHLLKKDETILDLFN